MVMDLTGEARLFDSLRALEMRYWFDVDRNDGCNAHDFYVEDCSFVIGDDRFVGRDEVRGFYEWRKARGARTARHIASNLWLDATDFSAPVLRGILFLYAADGLPVLPSVPAILVADCETTFVETDASTWLVRARVLSPVFAGGTAPTLPSIARMGRPEL